MNYREAVETAVDNCYSIVCSPKIYPRVVEYARKLESERDMSHPLGSIVRRIMIEYHPEQIDPEILIFDRLEEWRAYLDQMNEKKQARRNL